MNSDFYQIISKFVKTALAFLLGICLIVLPIGANANAARTSMTGDFTQDTLTVAKTLKETVSIPSEDEKYSEVKKEAVFVIDDYISRYRNRSQVNSSVSFTTMQTALNSLAGHYKTFPNRPVPEKLKNRLNDELSKAESLVLQKD
tara:strand:+ start:35345 stop:35779 length:435 start_codon:yes stop_codon:yes gene_type:complete